MTEQASTSDRADLRDLIDRYNDAWNGHDVEAIVALHAPDMVFENHTAGERAEGGAVPQHIAGIFEAWPDIALSTRRRYLRDGLVVQEWTATATHTRPLRRGELVAEPSGRRIEWKGVDVILVEDGLIKRKDVYSDSVSILRQLGLLRSGDMRGKEDPMSTVQRPMAEAGVGPERPFSRELWSGIEDIYQAIVDHPFITGLTDGSLQRASFEFYVVQDAHYLREYARALSVAAARAPAEGDIAMFNEHAAGAIAVERSLHESFFADFGLSEGDVARTPPAPTNLAYTSYLLATAYGGSFTDLLAAVLPCYWIYWEVGKALLARGSPDPLYRRWIETYGGEEFAEVVRAVLALTDRLGPDLGVGERRSAARHFAITSRYEWMFWDMGYRREGWPV